MNAVRRHNENGDVSHGRRESTATTSATKNSALDAPVSYTGDSKQSIDVRPIAKKELAGANLLDKETFSKFIGCEIDADLVDQLFIQIKEKQSVFLTNMNDSDSPIKK